MQCSFVLQFFFSFQTAHCTLYLVAFPWLLLMFFDFKVKLVLHILCAVLLIFKISQCNTFLLQKDIDQHLSQSP